jgi:metallopeptidase MepB
VSTDSELRDASSKAEEMMDEFNIEASMREDIFQLVDAAWKRESEKKELDGESKRLLEKEWKSYVRNGLGIEKGPKRDRFKEIKKRLSQVCWVVLGLRDEADDDRSKSSSRRT